MIGTRIAIRLLVTAFVLLCIDGCFHRDPTVDLGNGYEIVAVSAASPCLLNYRPWVDEREYTGWHAIASRTVDGPDGPERTPFVLAHDEHEWLNFDDEEQWRHEWQEKHATFGPDEVGRVEGITGFQDDGRYVIGAFDGGFFLLDAVRNRVDTFRDRNLWQQAVETATEMSVSQLADPKSWFVQTRNLAVLAVLAFLFLPWCLWPLVRQKHRQQPARCWWSPMLERKL